VANDTALIGNFDFNVSPFIEDHTLATQSRIEAGIVGPINEVFFFIRNFFQKILAFFDVHMAGRTGAHAATVVVEVYVVVLRYFKDRLIQKISVDRFGGYFGVFKQKMYDGHAFFWWFTAQMYAYNTEVRLGFGLNPALLTVF
jgi:hypothetical protein